jgi:hypothetical protein
MEPTKSAMDQSCRAGSAQEPGWLAEGLRLGSGMPAPSGQIPPPWAWWENEAPTTRAARHLLKEGRIGDRSGRGWPRGPSVRAGACHTPHAGQSGDSVVGFLLIDQPIAAHR